MPGTQDGRRAATLQATADAFREWIDAEHINNVLFMAGPEWGKPATPEEILSALDAAGFEIVRKPRDS